MQGRAGARQPPVRREEFPQSGKRRPKVPAKSGKRLPQKPTKLPQKPEVEDFAGNFAGNDLIDDEDLEASDFDFYANVDRQKWRLETRTYTKKDGTVMLYFNYRRRKSYVNPDGKRIIPYRRGGKRVLKHGEK